MFGTEITKGDEEFMLIFLKNHITTLLILITLVSVLIFFFLLGNHASANNGADVCINGYDSVLIRDGDTLNSIAKTYSVRYSNASYHSYREAIISLNALTSDHIQSGEYILLPKYR